jgi:hypothetical protein
MIACSIASTSIVFACSEVAVRTRSLLRAVAAASLRPQATSKRGDSVPGIRNWIGSGLTAVKLTNDERRAEKDDYSRDELDSGRYEPDVGVGGCRNPLEDRTGDDATQALNDEEERHASGTQRSRGRLGCVGWPSILDNSDAEVLEDSPAGEYDPAAGGHFD